MNDLVEQGKEIWPRKPDDKKLSVSFDDSEKASFFSYIANCVNIGDILANLEKGSRLVVQFPTLALQRAYETGELVLNAGKQAGVTWPTLVKILENNKREFVANLPVAEEYFLQGNPIQHLTDGINNLMVQLKLETLEKLCKRILENTNKILAGQRDDRIGHLIAGQTRLQEALAEKNDKDKEKGLGDAINLIHTAQGEFLAGLQSRVSAFLPVPSSWFKRTWMNIWQNGQYYGEKDDEVDEIGLYYDLYLESTKMLAVCYCHLDKDDMVHHVFEVAQRNIEALDFKKIKTIDVIHKDSDNTHKFYYVALSHFHDQKKQVLLETKPYDYIEYETTKEELMEGIANVKQL